MTPRNRRQTPQPRERFAERYRRAHARRDREPTGRYAPGRFGARAGLRAAYAARPGYRRTLGRSRPPAPDRSGWPYPVREVAPDAEERHLRALADRDLARAVDLELYNVIGDAADAVAVYADDAVVTLAGVLPHPRLARHALDAARWIPGVYRVRSALRIARR